MLYRDDDTYENQNESDFLNYEFSSIPYESLQGERAPFFPNMPGSNFPQSGNFLPGFNPPEGGSNFPGGGYGPPGGGFNPPGMPKSPPPNYMPSKKDKGVESFSQGGGGIGTKTVSANSIRICLFKYTYIWEVNGRSYWAFLFNVDKVSLSGFRWLGRNWVYFGINLKRIDSFVCYRSTHEDIGENSRSLKQDDISLLISKKEYFLNGTREVYTQTLASLDIPEVKEDFITQTIGYIDDNKVNSEVPCVKARNINYRINLEVTYPSNFDKDLKNKINEFANEATTDAYITISSTRSAEIYSTPLEIFNSSLELIPTTLKTFSNSFNSNLKLLNLSADNYRSITYSIRDEKILDNWKPYFYNYSLF
ncbi:hypothetical protein [Clostridium vincentii]|uniref:Uncharacterized protein n=1 Tax=Clostridium vincentii TaxID=52704 RepID=A0A2T0B8I0_9CLOT|nr:hypothetical protein [Clostridium vincentii]PRR80199.1 hypothetical protein CLVI_31010 [Clostridium vincentii]